MSNVKIYEGKKPAVSVIIPIYNSAQWIKQTLDSICNQTLADIEILCIDDGSSDQSSEIILNHCKSDFRIQYIYQENAGAGVARNYGIELAQGEYIIFLDSDDLFNNNMLENMYLACKANDAEICICDAMSFNTKTGDQKPMHIISKYANEGLINTPNLGKHLFQSFNPAPWNKLFKHTFIVEHKIKFQEQQCVNDFYFTYCAIAQSKNIYVIREPYVKYRRGTESSLRDAREKYPDCELNARCLLRETLTEARCLNKNGLRSLDTLCIYTVKIFRFLCNDIEAFNWFYEAYGNALKTWNLQNKRLSYFTLIEARLLLWSYKNTSVEGLLWAYAPLNGEKESNMQSKIKTAWRLFIAAILHR